MREPNESEQFMPLTLFLLLTQQTFQTEASYHRVAVVFGGGVFFFFKYLHTFDSSDCLICQLAAPSIRSNEAVEVSRCFSQEGPRKPSSTAPRTFPPHAIPQGQRGCWSPETPLFWQGCAVRPTQPVSENHTLSCVSSANKQQLGHSLYTFHSLHWLKQGLAWL